MGCCMSSPPTNHKPQSKNLQKPQPNLNSHPHHQTQTPIQKPPPPEAKTTTPSTWNSLQQQQQEAAPVVEEETIKEVTHITNPTSTIREPKTQFIKKQKSLKQDEILTPEISQSQPSEICNVSDTKSTGTNFSASIGRKEDEATSKKKRVEVRSSPGKVPIKNRPNRVKRTERGGRVMRKDGVGSGERSGRRSRSPVTGSAGEVRRGRFGATTGKVTGKAGGRRLVDVGEGGGRKGTGTGNIASGSGVKVGVNDDVLMGEAGQEEKGINDGNGDGDNPLVSLECFIFL